MPTIYRLDLTLTTPEENLALEEALLLEASSAAERGEGRDEAPAFLRFWESPRHCVVLGVSCRVRDDVDLERCHADGVPVLRRVSGGGTVLLGPGCLNFALVLPLAARPDLADVRRSYAAIVERTGEGLGVEGVAMRGSCDLALGDRKLGGSAQKRTRSAVLHQGTALCGFDIELVARYLREPAKQPDYRGRRDHASFLTNLPLSAAEVRERIARAWNAVPPPDWRPPDLAGLIAARYAKREWNERF
jgi:lipoate-protein ligase A